MSMQDNDNRSIASGDATKVEIVDYYYENGGKGTVLGVTLKAPDGELYKYGFEADFDAWCYKNNIPQNLDKDDERFKGVEEYEFTEIYKRENDEYRYKTFNENVDKFDADTWGELLSNLVEQALEDGFMFDVTELENAIRPAEQGGCIL